MKTARKIGTYVRTYKQCGLARLIIWTQAFEKFGACRLARANRILRYCHRLELEQSGAEGERNAGPFFPCPPGQAASWAATRSGSRSLPSGVRTTWLNEDQGR